MYTIGDAKVSHPEPGTLQVVRFRKAAIWNEVGVIFWVMLIGMGFFMWPRWNAWVRADERPWCALRVGLLLLWPTMVLGLGLVVHRRTSRQARLYGERDVLVFAQERGTIERNGRLVACFADVAHVEVIVDDLSCAEVQFPTRHTLRVTLKDGKALDICEVFGEFRLDQHQLSYVAREFADILGVELRCRRYA